MAKQQARDLGRAYGLGDTSRDVDFSICIQQVAAPQICSSSTPDNSAFSPGQLMEVVIAHKSPTLAAGIRFMLNGGIAQGANDSQALEGRAVGRIEIFKQG